MWASEFRSDCASLVHEPPRVLRALALKLCLVCCKRRVPHLLLLSARVRLGQAVLATEAQAAVGALAHQLDGRIATLLVGSSAVLAALLGTATQTEHQVQRALLLDVVVTQRAPVLELLAGKNETLLVRRDTLLVLDLGLDWDVVSACALQGGKGLLTVLNRVTALNLERDGLASEGLDEHLHG